MANTAGKPKTEPRTLVAFVARMVQVIIFFCGTWRGLRADGCHATAPSVTRADSVANCPATLGALADRVLCGVPGSSSQLGKDMDAFQGQELAGSHHAAVSKPGDLCQCDWGLYLSLLPVCTPPGPICR